MKKMSHLELYGLIKGFKNEVYSYSLAMRLLNNHIISLDKTDYLGFLNILEYETNSWNLVNPDAIHNNYHMYYETIKENDKIKIMIKKGPQDDTKTISTFKINIIDHYQF